MRGIGAWSLLVLAAGLRAWGLADWSLDGDEFYVWRDVGWLLDEGDWAPGVRSHPLGYLGIAGVVSVLGMDELSLRLFPALCGTLAVAALLFGRRDVLSAGAASVAGLLAAISPWLVYHSQTARFYGPLLLFSTLAILWMLPGPRARPGWAMVAFLAAVASHPTAAVLLVGLLVSLRDESRRRGAVPRSVLVIAGLGVVAVVASGSTVLELVLQALGREGGPADYDARHFVLGLGYNTHGVLLLAGVGVLLAMFRRGQVTTALAVHAVVPAALLLVAALLGASIHQRYVLAVIPAMLLLGGGAVATGWVAGGSARLGAALLLGVGLLIPAPALVDHLRTGNRHDWRGLAAEIASRADPDTIFVVDEHSLLEEVYLPPEAGFADMDFFEEPLKEERWFEGFVNNRRDCWVVLKASRLGGAYEGRTMSWVGEHFEELLRWGPPPGFLVRHDNRLVVFRRREQDG